MRTFRIVLAASMAALGVSIITAPPAGAATPAALSNFQQCQNQVSQSTCNAWTNGGLNNSNHYAEDMVVPQRAVFATTPGVDYVFSVTYDYANGTVHGYDFLATWNASVGGNPCLGLAASLCAAAPTTLAMSHDPLNGTHDVGIPANWTLYGGTLVSTTTPTHSGLQATTTITFRSNPGVTSVLLLFGGHLAVGTPATADRSWGNNNGASKYPGGSLSIRQTGSSRNNGINTNAIAPLPAAAFTITKSVTPTTASAGDPVTYTITVTNTGGTAGSATFTDDYNNGLTNLTVPNGCTNNSPSTGQMTCTTGSLAAHTSTSFQYTANLPTTFSGSTGVNPCAAGQYKVTNTATFATGTNVTVGTGPASASVCVNAAAKFTVVKTARTSTAHPGDNVTYDVLVTNTGSAPGAATFVDDYDDNATFVGPASGATCVDASTGTAPNIDKKVSCTTASLAAGAFVTVTYQLKMPASFTGSGTSGCDGDYPVVNGVSLTGSSDSETVCVDAAPAFTVKKTAEVPTALPGDTVTYDVVVKNTGTAPGAATFVDDYDDRASYVGTATNATCVDASTGTAPNIDKKESCTTASLNPGQSVTVTYTLTMPTAFSGSGTSGCNGDYPVVNSVSLTGSSSSATVCVSAGAKFTVTKTAKQPTAAAGDTVEYEVVVKNIGSAPGVATFVDNYDDNATFVGPATNATCVDSSTGTAPNIDKKETCTTASLDPGQSVTVTYKLTMPSSFTGGPTLTCTNGGYGVVNTVTVPGSTSSQTVCVTASPNMSVTKTGVVGTNANGEQIITYTLAYTNTGTAQANLVTITDQLPAGTSFDSCTGGCSTAGSPVTATWTIGSVAPLTGSGSVQLTVKVTTNQVCSISNTANLKLNGTTAASSTVSVNVTPQPNPSGAHANGSAIGVQVKARGLLQLAVGLLNVIVTGNGNNQVLTAGQTSSSQTGPGGPVAHESHLLSLNLTGILSAGVIQETSASTVTASPTEARQTSTSEVASVCLVPVAGICTVKSDTVRAVASTLATDSYASVSSAGSTIENLYVAGVAVPVDLSQTTKIPLNAVLFGSNSYVAINERTSSAGLSGSSYAADLTVSMIHVKITNLALVGALDVVVAQATAHSDFPKTLVCGGQSANQSVSGHALAAKLYTGPLLADLTLGFVKISPLGGTDSQHVVGAVVPSTGVAVNAQVADTFTTGSFNATSSSSHSWAEVAGDGTKPACVLQSGPRCVVEATAIRAEANSAATSAGSTSTDAGSQLLGLSVLTIPINANAAPNTVIPLAGIGFIILNEQFCDNGALASHSCSAAGHSGITVRGVRIVITVANNILNLNPGVELIVSEAHADTTYGVS